MLNEIEKALKDAFELPVYYGSSMEATGKKVYDYIVFWRDHVEVGPGQRGDRVEFYNVALVRKDYIPEGEDLKLIQTLNAVQGLKRNGDIQYEYMTMPGTALAMEAATCTFTHALRACGDKAV